ncbi:MAG: flagellar basal body L-ring protein FlgH [Pseudohongiellaceae bacterium]|nr:flagellar basal body L-ring protein FlgH [Pseudohongiellaceae bacterium]
MNTSLAKKIMIIGCCLSTTACLTRPVDLAEPDDPRYAPVMTQTPMPPVRATGSIYTAASAVDLYQRRAHRVGDVLTIALNEATSASKSSGTTISRENDLSVTEPNVLGTGFLGTGVNLGTSVDSGLDFSGSGASDQSNQLIGSITVTVSNVLPNGLLEVRGEKWLQLNRGNEFIRISGLVRKEDISPDNTILSTRVADVRIAYSGTGTVADSNEAGWLTSFFVSSIWPF